MDCAIVSIANILGISSGEVTRIIGHAGLEVVYPHRSGSSKYKGIHPQEYMDVFRRFGKVLVYVEADPYLGQIAERPNRVYPNPAKRFLKYLKGQEGLIHLPNHCCWFKGDIIYDPNGPNYDLSRNDLEILGAWVSHQIT